MSFRDLLLPINCDLEWDSASGFDTSVVRTDNGSEKRNANWDGTLARAQIKYTGRTQAVWSEIDELFQICQGRAYAFKVRDPRKYIALPGEGVFVGGQAVLRITKGAFTLDKVITKLDASVSLTGGTVNYSTGVSADGATAWSGKFYLCMRFDVDSLEVVGVNKKSASGEFIGGQPDVPLVEVLGE